LEMRRGVKKWGQGVRGMSLEEFPKWDHEKSEVPQTHHFLCLITGIYSVFSYLPYSFYCRDSVSSLTWPFLFYQHKMIQIKYPFSPPLLYYILIFSGGTIRWLGLESGAKWLLVLPQFWEYDVIQVP
jgi:hypothetical protein